MSIGRRELRGECQSNRAEVQAGGERCVQGEIMKLCELHLQRVISVGKCLQVLEGELMIRVCAILAGVVLLELI